MNDLAWRLVAKTWTGAALCRTAAAAAGLMVFTAGMASEPPLPNVNALDARGNQFIWFSRFGAFAKTRGTRSLETVLTSPVVVARIQWDELVASWNAEMSKGSYIKVEARAIRANGSTEFYTLGLWSDDSRRYPRESVPGQDDESGKVSTDTLILKRPANRFQLRITLGSETRLSPRLRFLGVALTDSKAVSNAGLTPRRVEATEAWGVTLPVPERSQMAYPNGNVLCSPTTVSMILSYWARQLKRSDLDRDVPEIAQAIYDAKWEGTGNWVFNTAYAGSLRGMRAYVARLSDVSELEQWIARGIPVGLSLCYDRLRGRPPRGKGNGHLVVCVGFTTEGNPVINDPGTAKNVRKVFPRENLVSAWAYSRNAAYLIYPRDAAIPSDRQGHWASWTARMRTLVE